MVGQLADEPDRVGDERPHAVAGVDLPRQWVKRREESILDVHLVRAREAAQDRGLPGVGVTDERRLELAGPRLTHHFASRLHLAQPLLQDLDAVIDESTVRLELRFAGASHPDTPAKLLEVRPHPRQPGQHVLQLRKLDLHLRLARAGARGEDVEDELRAVHHALADGVLEVLPL
jgi:hypothetical protein